MNQVKRNGKKHEQLIGSYAEIAVAYSKLLSESLSDAIEESPWNLSEHGRRKFQDSKLELLF